MVAPSFGESGGFKFGDVTTAAASSSVPTTGGSVWHGSGLEFFFSLVNHSGLKLPNMWIKIHILS
jgi:hypothetical protein